MGGGWGKGFTTLSLTLGSPVVTSKDASESFANHEKKRATMRFKIMLCAVHRACQTIPSKHNKYKTKIA